MKLPLPATVLGAGYSWMVLYANAADGKMYGWRWGVNESAISKISEGHTVMFALGEQRALTLTSARRAVEPLGERPEALDHL
ncbi:MAG TPA: hypothetical protein VF526_00155 [Solirubrobacteraceae bacterium]